MNLYVLLQLKLVVSLHSIGFVCSFALKPYHLLKLVTVLSYKLSNGVLCYGMNEYA